MDLVSLLTSTTSKGNPNAWDISKAYYDAGADAWDVSKTFYSGVSFSVSGQEATTQSLFFKPDGTKMYICGNTGDDVNEYTLSTPWLVSSATYVQNFSVSAQETNPLGLFFKPDGTKMYICGNTGDDVNEYDLSTAWDISTASYVQNFSVSAQETVPSGLSFKPDGTKMYVIGVVGDDVNEYDLSTPWDISTSSYLQNFSVASQDGTPQDLYFKEDGTKMYVIGDGLDRVYEYDLSTSWDVSTASFIQFFSVSSQTSASISTGIYFNPDGSSFYVASNVAVYQYTIGGFSVAAQETQPRGLVFKPDGTKLYVTGVSGDNVNEYNLSTAWDILTASYLQAFSVSAQEADPQGLVFKPDGTKMYVVGLAGDDVNEYDLSTPWDISTASYLQNFSVSGQDGTPTDVFFKPDGTKMYILGQNGNDVNEYNLSTPWDVSSASYLQNFSIATEEGTATGLFFKPDGTKMYVVGRVGNDVNEYSLSSAWDISTASYVQNFNLRAQGSIITGVFFKPDGTQFFTVEADSDKVFSYLISPE